MILTYFCDSQDFETILMPYDHHICAYRIVFIKISLTSLRLRKSLSSVVAVSAIKFFKIQIPSSARYKQELIRR